jgi:hypothetical protein
MSFLCKNVSMDTKSSSIYLFRTILSNGLKMKNNFILFLFILAFAYLPLWAEAQNPPAVPAPKVEVDILSEMPSDTSAAPAIETPSVVIDDDAKAAQVKKNLANVPTPPEKPIPEIGEDLTVLELFSTQACTFCPKADALMKQLIKKKNLIALSCHIDYFDVKEGSLSQPICSTRQVAYESSLGSGPKYTPQMVVNGRYDAIGYLVNELDEAFIRAQESKIQPIEVEKRKDKLFDLVLPDIEVKKYKIWLMVFDNPRTITVADGANRGKDMTYYNVVSKAGFLGNWKGQAKTIKFDAKLDPTSKGFAVLVQDEETNHVAAATQYLK